MTVFSYDRSYSREAPKHAYFFPIQSVTVPFCLLQTCARSTFFKIRWRKHFQCLLDQNYPIRGNNFCNVCSEILAGLIDIFDRFASTFQNLDFDFKVAQVSTCKSSLWNLRLVSDTSVS